MGEPRLELLVESPLTSVGMLGEAVITVVHTELTMEGLNASRTAYDTICRTYPGTVSLTLVLAGIRLPDAAMRHASSDLMKATKSRTRSAARVFLGDGFWLSAVRSVLTAIELIHPYDLPRRTFSAIQPAAHWLAKSISENDLWGDRLNDAVSRMIGASPQQSQRSS